MKDPTTLKYPISSLLFTWSFFSDIGMPTVTEHTNDSMAWLKDWCCPVLMGIAERLEVDANKAEGDDRAGRFAELGALTEIIANLGGK